MKILLRGKPGIGKTTIVEKLVNILKLKGRKVVGFYTKEWREGGIRKGFFLHSIGSGETSILAEKNFPSPYKVGSYGVNVKALEKVISEMEEEIDKGDFELLVIDEIGKMETFSKRFVEFVVKIFYKDVNILATIPVYKLEVVERIQDIANVDVLEVTYSNRDKLVEEILRRYGL